MGSVGQGAGGHFAPVGADQGVEGLEEGFTRAWVLHGLLGALLQSAPPHAPCQGPYGRFMQTVVKATACQASAALMAARASFHSLWTMPRTPRQRAPAAYCNQKARDRPEDPSS